MEFRRRKRAYRNRLMTRITAGCLFDSLRFQWRVAQICRQRRLMGTASPSPISAKRLFVCLDTALPPWVACFCLRVTVSFQSPNGGESFDLYVLNFKYCALHVCPSCSVFRGIMHPCMICNSTPLFISRVHVHNAHF